MHLFILTVGWLPIVCMFFFPFSTTNWWIWRSLCYKSSTTLQWFWINIMRYYEMTMQDQVIERAPADDRWRASRFTETHCSLFGRLNRRRQTQKRRTDALFLSRMLFYGAGAVARHDMGRSDTAPGDKQKINASSAPRREETANGLREKQNNDKYRRNPVKDCN